MSFEDIFLCKCMPCCTFLCICILWLHCRYVAILPQSLSLRQYQIEYNSCLLTALKNHLIYLSLTNPLLRLLFTHLLWVQTLQSTRSWAFRISKNSKKCSNLNTTFPLHGNQASRYWYTIFRQFWFLQINLTKGFICRYIPGCDGKWLTDHLTSCWTYSVSTLWSDNTTLLNK